MEIAWNELARNHRRLVIARSGQIVGNGTGKSNLSVSQIRELMKSAVGPHHHVQSTAVHDGNSTQPLVRAIAPQHAFGIGRVRDVRTDDGEINRALVELV